MTAAGQRKSTKNKVPKSLLVPLIISVIAIIIIILNHNPVKRTIIYPKYPGKYKPVETTRGEPVETTRGEPVETTRGKPVQTACGMPVQNDPMIQVGNLNTYVIGSYLEHRRDGKMVLTVAIMRRSENAVYYCLFCCNGRSYSASASYSLHSDHFGFEYGTGDIMCNVPSLCTSPEYMAVTSESENGQLVQLQNIQTFRNVRNLQPKDPPPFKFTVCISVMYEYVNVLGLVQAMEMYKMLGVQRVAIYKTSVHPNIQRVLDFYVKQGFLEIIPWNVLKYIKVSRGWRKDSSSGELHYFGQIPALNDCVYRYMYQSKYVALNDMDEFILPMNSTSWTELLPKLEEIYGTNVGFEFESNYFPDYMKDSNPKFEPDSWKQVTGENILEYIKNFANDPNEFNNIKVIVNPRLVYSTTVHGLLDSRGGTIRVDRNIARMYHMRKDGSRLKRTVRSDPHIRDYAEKLIPAVSEVLQKALNA